MYKYLLTGNNFAGEMEFSYDRNDLLKFFENRTDLPGERYLVFLGKFPATPKALENLVKGSKSLTLARTALEITFKDFWDAYGNKVGNKVRAEKIWKTLTDTEHLMIMEHLPKYDRYLSVRPRMEKLYPETYLNQRRWENELPK